MYSNPSVSVPCGVIPSEVSALMMVMSVNPGTFAGTVTCSDVALLRVTSEAA